MSPLRDFRPPAAQALDGMVEELCTRRHPLQIATPYVSFPSRFLERQGDTLLLRATLGQDTARHALAGPLRLRFAWGLAYLAGATRLLAYEQAEGRRVLRMALPERFVPDEQRRAFRLPLVGRSTGALGSEDTPILRVSLEELSPFGAGVFCLDALPAEGFHAGRLLSLSLGLEAGPSFTTGVRIRHGSGQVLGLAFEPAISGKLLESLQAWMAPRLRELARRWERRTELRTEAERAVRPRIPPEGLLVVSPRPELREAVTRALEGLAPLRLCPPALGPLRASLQEAPPLLLLLDVTGADGETRARLKALVEAAGSEAPLVVLGSPEDLDPARALARELRNAPCLAWQPGDAAFFRRLVQWRLRRALQERQATP